MSFQRLAYLILVVLLLSGCESTKYQAPERESLKPGQDINDVIDSLPDFSSVPQPDMGKVLSDAEKHVDKFKLDKPTKGSTEIEVDKPKDGTFKVQRIIDGDTLEIKVGSKL
jgi:micrococcal nuclease